MPKMKAERPNTSDGKPCSYLNLTDEQGKVWAVELKLVGNGHAITKQMRELRNTLLEKLKAAVNG